MFVAEELLYAAFAAATNRVFFVRSTLSPLQFFMYRINNAFALTKASGYLLLKGDDSNFRLRPKFVVLPALRF